MGSWKPVWGTSPGSQSIRGALPGNAREGISLWRQAPGGPCLDPYRCWIAPLACFPHYFEAYLWPHFLSKSFGQDFPSQALNLGLESSRPLKDLKDLLCPTNTHEVLWTICIPKLQCKWTLMSSRWVRITYLWTFHIGYPRKTSTTATYLDGKNAISTICFHHTQVEPEHLTFKGPPANVISFYLLFLGSPYSSTSVKPGSTNPTSYPIKINARLINLLINHFTASLVSILLFFQTVIQMDYCHLVLCLYAFSPNIT